MFDECDEFESERIERDMVRMRGRANARERAVWANFDRVEVEVFDDGEPLDAWSLDEALGPLARTIGR
jgi:hypothetical protein